MHHDVRHWTASRTMPESTQWSPISPSRTPSIRRGHQRNSSQCRAKQSPRRVSGLRLRNAAFNSGILSRHGHPAATKAPWRRAEDTERHHGRHNAEGLEG